MTILAQKHTTTKPDLQPLADILGVSVQSLDLLGVVRTGDAWHYPERDAQAQVVGHNRRFPDGTKKATKDSKRGLCYPVGESWALDPQAGSSPDAPVLIVEGMSDTAAAMDVGLPVIGRSTATPGSNEMAWLVELMADRHVVVVGEHDASGAGVTGAEKTANALIGKATSVKIVYPPEDVKDLRAWIVTHKADANEIHAAIHGADVWTAQANYDFPAIVPMDDAPAGPPIPLDALPDVLRDIVEASSGFSEVSPALAIVPLLGVLATACQRSFEIESVSGHTEPLSLFLAGIARPGERKSDQTKTALPPIEEWEIGEAERVAEENKASTAQGIALDAQAKHVIKSINDAKTDAERLELSEELVELQEKKEGLTQHARQLYGSDITPEALGIMLKNNDGCGAIITSEGGSFISGMAGRYAKGDASIDLPMQAWGAESIRINRVGRPSILIANPHMSIAMMIQPSLAVKMRQNEQFQTRGLNDRFFWFIPESNLGYRTGDGQPIPRHVKQAWSDSIMALLQTPPAPDEDRAQASKPHTLRLSGGAHRSWRAYSDEIETYHRPEHDRYHLSQYCGKWPGQTARVAGVFHCLTHAHNGPQHQPVSGETMEQAIHFCRVLLDHAAVTFGMMTRSEDCQMASTIWRWISQHKHTDFTANQAWQSLRGGSLFTNAETVKVGLSVLVDRGYVGHERKGKSDHYISNPMALRA